MTTIQQHREALQDLLVSGVVTSVEAQTIALVYFAKKFGYVPVNGDIRKGFTNGYGIYYSLTHMQKIYNHMVEYMSPYGIIKRISLQYNKKLGKVTSQKEYLKFDFTITE